MCNGEEFHTYVQPHAGALISQEALDINGLSLTSSEIKNAPNVKQACALLCKFMEKSVSKYDKTDKLIMAGFNVKFDDDFLRMMFKHAGNPFLGSYRWPTLYDIQTPAIAYLYNHRGKMQNFQLGTVAKALGISMKNRVLHNALDDIKLTVEIDEALCQK